MFNTHNPSLFDILEAGGEVKLPDGRTINRIKDRILMTPSAGEKSRGRGEVAFDFDMSYLRQHMEKAGLTTKRLNKKQRQEMKDAVFGQICEIEHGTKFLDLAMDDMDDNTLTQFVENHTDFFSEEEEEEEEEGE